MSVVNKMLRDLESRQRPRKATANYVPPTKPKTLLVGVSLAFCICISAFLYTLVSVNDESAQPIQQAPASTFKPQKGDQLAQVKDTSIAGQAPQVIDAPQPNKPAQLLAKNVPSTIGQAPLIVGQAPQLSSPSSVMLKQASPLINAYQGDLSEIKTDANEFNVKPSYGAKNTLSNLRAKAHLASQKGRDEEVISLLYQILEVDGREVRTRKQLAAMLFSKSMLTEAQSVLQRGLRITPADSSLRLMLSRIHFKTGNNEQAFNVLLQHPYSQIANDELLSFRAALAEKIGKYEIAEQDYQMLVRRNPLEAKWWLGLGVAQDKQQLSQRAIDSYLQAQQLKQLPAQVEDFVEQRIQLLARPS